MMTRRRDLDYYMGLPYRIVIIPDQDGDGFTATIPDLRGCMASGETVEDACETVEEIKRIWLEAALERGWAIPEPVTDEAKEYSGKFNLRLPRSLHRKLVEIAEAEGTSLNQQVLAFLAECVGLWRQSRQQTPPVIVKPFYNVYFRRLEEAVMSTVNLHGESLRDADKQWVQSESPKIQIRKHSDLDIQ
jgi:antitoxin HicB